MTCKLTEKTKKQVSKINKMNEDIIMNQVKTL